ncbi:MAG: TetR/AcrR family transcriptional regulator [Caldilineaceae bacterium]
MTDIPQNETRERILRVAEKLFMKRGFASVKLRDIAAEVGMRHASLYYYAPDGKEGLFVEVLKRSLTRYREGIREAITATAENLPAQMRAAADWIIKQPPMDLNRMTDSDLPAIDSSKAAELSKMAIESVTIAIMEALQAAADRGEIAPMHDYQMAAMAFTVLIQSTHHIPDKIVEHQIPGGRQALGRDLVNMLLHGWLPR